MLSELSSIPFNGDMRGRLQSLALSKTGLGALETWPSPLKTAAVMMLDSALPMWICWGPELLLLYNDSYATFLGEKHPRALMAPWPEVWPETWEYVEPVILKALAGVSTFLQDVEFVLLRSGQPEQTWFTYSIAPLRDDQGRGVGIFGTAIETTAHVLARRRHTAESEHLRQLFSQAPSFMALVRGPEHRFEIANPAYMRLLMQRPVMGKTFAEALPDAAEQGYLALLDQVYASGTPYSASGAKYVLQAEHGESSTELFVNFVLQPVVGADDKVNGIFIEGVDVTNQVLANRELERINQALALTVERQKATEQQQTFQLALSDLIRPLADPDDVIAAASELLGKHLGAARVVYGAVDESSETVTMRRDWTNGELSTMFGAVLRFDDFGPLIGEICRAGKNLVIDDVTTDQRSAANADAYIANGVRSLVAISLIKKGRVQVILSIHDAKPRYWTAEEVALAQDMADRTWAAVQGAYEAEKRRRAEENLRENAAHLQFILESAQIGDAVWDMTTNINTRSLQHDRCFGYTEPVAEWSFEIFIEHVHPDDRQYVVQDFQAAIAESKNWHVEFRVIWADQSVHWVALHGSVYFVDSKPKLMIGIVIDITDRKRSEEKLRHVSLHDSLTDLPNRAMLFEYAGHLLPHNRRINASAAVLFLDLDRFKPINDIHGHETGDAVLKEVASRLSRSLRAEDIVVRLGGDEFVILLQDIKQASFAGEVASHIVNRISEPYLVSDLALSLSASVGISIFPNDGQDIDTLISRADTAMYQAKQAGRNNFQFYSAEFAAGAKLQLAIEQQLRSALRNDDFHLCYQPVLDLQSGRTVSVEALIRWKNTDIGPDRFVPVAEATGIINPIGRWVLKEASRQHKAWLADGLPAMPVAVNVSAVEFRDRDFVNRFKRLLDEYGIEPAALQVELTETAVMDDIEHAIKVLSQLRALGVIILLDDFGTGHSSLAYLARLPLNKIKIDKSFVTRLEHDVASRAITDAMLALSHTLGLEVVAEGIESQPVLDYLRSRGCQQAQGYYLSLPMSGEAFRLWYGEQRARMT